MNIPKSAVSGHWRVLREAGLRSTRAQGRVHVMQLRSADLQARLPGLLDAILTASRVAP
jgi:DNA-binding transcriptional ArsR family regulator